MIKILHVVFVLFASALSASEWQEGLPNGLVGRLEVSPRSPSLGEPFYVRAIIKNTGNKPVDAPPSFFSSKYFGQDGAFVLDIVSASLKRSGYSRALFKNNAYGYIIAPIMPKQGIRSEQISPQESRVLLLAEFEVFPAEHEDQNRWNDFLEEKDTLLRLNATFDKKLQVGRLAIPIRFKPYSTVLSNLVTEENSIFKEKTRNLDDVEKENINMMLNRCIGGNNRSSCLLLPSNEQEDFEKKYPPGTLRSQLHLMILTNNSEYTETGSKKAIRWLWSLPEIERQYFVTTFFFVKRHESRYAKSFGRFFEELLRMYPENYQTVSGDSRAKHYEIYDFFWNREKKLSQSEIRAKVDSLMNTPAPDYAGIGNESRGFFLPLQKWSISEDEAKLVSVFNDNAIFETAEENDVAIPIKSLLENEQKYIRELIDIPNTGNRPLLK